MVSGRRRGVRSPKVEMLALSKVTQKQWSGGRLLLMTGKVKDLQHRDKPHQRALHFHNKHDGIQTKPRHFKLGSTLWQPRIQF